MQSIAVPLASGKPLAATLATLPARHSTAAPPSPSTLLTAARAYLARGWSLLPLEPRDKRPAPSLLPLAYDAHKGRDVATWRPFQAAPPSMAAVEGWLAKGAGIGIVTGSVSGILAIDADGPSAVEWLEKHGGHTLMSDTGGGGLHALYAMPKGAPLGNRAALLKFEDGSKLDVRGEGGYIVAPPSIHPNGRPYAWRAGTEELQPAPLPPALVELLQPAPMERTSLQVTRERERPPLERTSLQVTRGRGGGRQAARLAAWVEAAIEGECEALRAAVEGTRNATLNSAALRCYSLALAAPDVLSESDVEQRLEDAARGYIASDGAAAFRATLASARKAAAPASLPCFEDEGEGAAPYGAKFAPGDEIEGAAPYGANFAPGDEGEGAALKGEAARLARWVKEVLTTEAAGWDGATLRLFLVAQLTLMLEGKEEKQLPGGAAYMAAMLGISKSTAARQVERLEDAGLLAWEKGERIADKGRVYHSGATLTIWRSPSLPPLEPGERDKAARDRAAKAREKAWEAVERLEAAKCPDCGGALGACCTDCQQPLERGEAVEAIAAALMGDCGDCGAPLPPVEGMAACPACGSMITPPPYGANFAPGDEGEGAPPMERSSLQVKQGEGAAYGANFAPWGASKSNQASHSLRAQNRTRYSPPPPPMAPPFPLEAPPDAREWLAAVEPHSGPPWEWEGGAP